MNHYLYGHEGEEGDEDEGDREQDKAVLKRTGTQVNPLGDNDLEGAGEPSDDDVKDEDT